MLQGVSAVTPLQQKIMIMDKQTYRRMAGIGIRWRDYKLIYNTMISIEELKVISGFEDDILDLIDDAKEFTRSDVQGIASALVRKIAGTKELTRQSEYEDRILFLIDHVDEITQSDLQGAVSALVWSIMHKK
jgi:hypothetical protein